MKYSIVVCIVILFVVTACQQRTNNAAKNNAGNTKAVLASKKKKDTIIKKIYPLTDSGQLMLHLDSLSRPPFPYQSDGRNYSPLVTISLSAFKSKKLFNIPIKLIPLELGGDFLDHGEDLDDNGILPDSIRDTFNLADAITYKAEGVLVATMPKFVVVDLDGILVTLSYHVDVIDAIRTSEGKGNNHWQLWRETTINKNLTMILHNWWTEREVPKADESENENWFIDSNGYIKKQPGRHKKHD